MIVQKGRRYNLISQPKTEFCHAMLFAPFDVQIQSRLFKKGRRNNLISLSMTEFGPDMSFPPYYVQINSWLFKKWGRSNLISSKKNDFWSSSLIFPFDVQTEKTNRRKYLYNLKESKNANKSIAKSLPKPYFQEYFEPINQVSNDHEHMMPDKLLLMPHYCYYQGPISLFRAVWLNKKISRAILKLNTIKRIHLNIRMMEHIFQIEIVIRF